MHGRRLRALGCRQRGTNSESLMMVWPVGRRQRADYSTLRTERGATACRRRCLLAHILGSGPIYYFDTMRRGGGSSSAARTRSAS